MSPGLLLCSLLGLPGSDVPAVGALEFSRELLTELSTENPLWPEACRRSPEDRIGVPRGVATAPSRPVARDYVISLRAAVSALPPPIRTLFDEHACAIVLVANMPTSGTIVMLEQDTTRGLIIVSVENTDRPANAWMTYKESTPFVASEEVSIVGTMADPSRDTRQATLEFVITHELAHIYDSAAPGDSIVGKIKALSWPREDPLVDLPFRHYPAVFFQDPLPAAEIEPVYEMIAGSGFPSPAAITSADEDFADSLATYVHSVVLNRPWQLEVRRRGEVTRRLQSCWGTERCRAKQTFLEYLIGDLKRAAR